MEMKKHGRKKGWRTGIDGTMFILHEAVWLKRSAWEMDKWMMAAMTQCAEV